MSAEYDTVTSSLHQALADKSNLQFHSLTDFESNHHTRMIDAGVAIVDDKLYIDWSQQASSPLPEGSLTLVLSAGVGQSFNLKCGDIKRDTTKFGT